MLCSLEWESNNYFGSHLPIEEDVLDLIFITQYTFGFLRHLVLHSWSFSSHYAFTTVDFLVGGI